MTRWLSKESIEKVKFLTTANYIVWLMSKRFHSVDEASPLLYWIKHSERRPSVRTTIMNEDDLMNLKIYAKHTTVSILAKVITCEWVYIEDLSYTNFILWLFNKEQYKIHESKFSLPKHTELQRILVPLELSTFVLSSKVRDTDWIYPEKILW